MNMLGKFWLEGRGLIAREATPEALAEQMELILGEPAIQVELEERVAEFGQSFSWESVAGIYLKIAEEVLELYDAEKAQKLGL